MSHCLLRLVSHVLRLTGCGPALSTGSPPEAANLPECSDGSSHSGPYTRLKVPPLDEERVYLLGYSLGSIVGLHAAALLPRVSGVAAFSGWSPFKANATSATGGNRA